jgi:hypothetical protein
LFDPFDEGELSSLIKKLALVSGMHDDAKTEFTFVQGEMARAKL